MQYRGFVGVILPPLPVDLDVPIRRAGLVTLDDQIILVADARLGVEVRVGVLGIVELGDRDGAAGGIGRWRVRDIPVEVVIRGVTANLVGAGSSAEVKARRPYRGATGPRFGRR